MVKVQTSDKFERVLNKLDKSIALQIDKILIKIITDPEIGKPMRFDRKDTREVYVGSLRLCYSYDRQNDILYFLDIYHKDEQ